MNTANTTVPFVAYCNIEVADDKYNNELTTPASGSSFIEHPDWGFSTQEQLEATNSLSATAPPQHQTNDKTYVWYPQPKEEPSPQSSSSELPAVESSFRCKLKIAGEAASKPVKRTTAGIRARVARLTKKQNKSKRSAALRRTPTPAPEGFSMASRFQRDPVPSAAARTARSAPAAGETMFVRQPLAGRNNRWVNTARLNSEGVADDSASVRSFASASTSDVARIVSD